MAPNPRPPRPRNYALAPPIILMILAYTAGLAVLIAKMATGKISLGWIAAIPLMATTTFAINFGIWYYGMMHEQYRDLAWKRAVTKNWYNSIRKVKLFWLDAKYGATRPGLYTPLRPDDFRLLSIAPGRPPDEIRCTLSVASMSELNVVYEALSYTWGPSHSPRHISLNGSPFTVTENLFNALGHLRSFDSTRTIWIDALAIDQSNLEERGQQVLLMNKIYSRAQRVVVWLGQDSPESTSAMMFLMQATAEDDSESWFYHRLKENFQQDLAQWQAVIQLFKNEYWRRVWIVQETAMAMHLNIHCGSLILPWRVANAAQVAWMRFRAQVTSSDEQHLLDAVETIPLEDDDVTVVTRAPRSMGPAPLTVIRNDIRASDHNTLFDLLSMTWNSLATNPRDKVYALLSLAKDCRDPVLAANYSLSTWEVYATAINFMIRNHGNLDLISYSGLHITYIPTLSRVPTWTPTFYWSWEAPTTGAHNRHIFGSSRRHFKASGDRKAVATVDIHRTRLSKTLGIDLGTLRAALCRIDYIDKFLFVSNQHLSRYVTRSLWPLQQCIRSDPSLQLTETLRENHYEDSKLIDDIRTLYYHFVHDGITEVDTGFESKPNVDIINSIAGDKTNELWRTLIFNRTADGIIPPEDWSSRFLAIIQGRLPDSPADYTDGLSTEHHFVAYIQPYLQAFRQTIAAKRAVFVTQKGRIGLSNLTARVGDAVTVVLGCHLPMAVRMRDKTGRATMHGPVYFHDYMQGRAIEELDRGDLTLETLRFV